MKLFLITIKAPELKTQQSVVRCLQFADSLAAVAIMAENWCDSVAGTNSVQAVEEVDDSVLNDRTHVPMGLYSVSAQLQNMGKIPH